MSDNPEINKQETQNPNPEINTLKLVVDGEVVELNPEQVKAAAELGIRSVKNSLNEPKKDEPLKDEPKKEEPKKEDEILKVRKELDDFKEALFDDKLFNTIKDVVNKSDIPETFKDDVLEKITTRIALAKQDAKINGRDPKRIDYSTIVASNITQYRDKLEKAGFNKKQEPVQEKMEDRKKTAPLTASGKTAGQDGTTKFDRSIFKTGKGEDFVKHIAGKVSKALE